MKSTFSEFTFLASGQFFLLLLMLYREREKKQERSEKEKERQREGEGRKSKHTKWDAVSYEMPRSSESIANK